jgi:hypothetical protein
MFDAMIYGLDPKSNVLALTLQFAVVVALTVKEKLAVLVPTEQLPDAGVAL